MPNEVTDPSLLAKLNGKKEVTDPSVLSQLNGDKSPVQALPVSTSRTLLEQGEQGATFGFSDEIMDSIGAHIASHYTGESYKDLYKQAREASQKRLEAEQQESPYISGASQVGAAIATPGVGEAKLLNTGGKMLGKLLPASLKFGKGAAAATKGAIGGAAGGAAYGAGTAQEGKRAEGAASGAQAGALTGGVVSGAMTGAAKAIAPKFDGAVETLRKAGVLMTPGQMSQGFSKWAENIATSVPLLGAVIRNGNQRSIESFNIAVLNRALEPVGEKMPQNIHAGREAIAYAEKQIGRKYDKILPQLSFSVDSEFNQGHEAFLKQEVSLLPKAQQEQFTSLLNALREQHLDPTTMKLTGKQFKEVESKLTFEGSRYSKSQDPAQRAYGEALNDYNGLLRDNLARQNPKYAGELRKINESWAMFKRAQGASARRVTSQGVFSPSDLAQDIKKRNPIGVFARGDAQLQGLADAGMEVLPSKVPDSGTAERAATLHLLDAATGAGIAANPATRAAALNPKVAIPAAGVASLYTKLGMKSVQKLTSAPTKTQKLIRRAVEQSNPAVSSGAGATQGGQNQ